MARHTVTLLAFLKGSLDRKKPMPGCCYLDGNDCTLRDGMCFVLEHSRCLWFEKAVLPTAQQIGQLQSLTAKYEDQVMSILERPETSGQAADRFCPGCSRPLLPRRRLCDSCRERRRKEAYRQYRRSKGVRCATVNENGLS